jgi:hypothetical protein
MLQDTDRERRMRIPGPGDPGFTYIKQGNLALPWDRGGKRNKE